MKSTATAAEEAVLRRLRRATGGGATVPAPSVTTTSVFSVWDGDWALLEEYDASNNVLEKYVEGYHGLVKTLVRNMYYYQDSLGSTSHVTDASGNLQESHRYDMYGKPMFFDALNTQVSTSHFGVADLYAGQRWLPELGLYDDRNRFMSPDLERKKRGQSFFLAFASLPAAFWWRWREKSESNFRVPFTT
jgi:hypothetical protein